MLSPEPRRNVGRRVHVPGVVPNGQSPSHEALTQSKGTGVPGPQMTTPVQGAYTLAAPRVPAANQGPAPEQIHAMQESLKSRMVELTRRMQGVYAIAPPIREEEQLRVNEELRNKTTEIQELRTQEQLNVRNSYLQRQKEIQNELESRVNDLAPGTLGEYPMHEGVAESPARFSPFVRVGTLLDGRVPALIPLTATRHWLVEGPTNNAHTLILNVLARYAAHFPVKHVKILVFDPRISGGLAALSPLRAINGASFPQAFSSAEGFADVLEQAIDTAASNVERMAMQGANNIVDLWNTTGVPDGQITIAVLLNMPYGVNDHLMKMIDRALRVPPSSGLSLLIHNDPGSGAYAQQIAEQTSTTRVTFDTNVWQCPEIFGDTIPFVPDPALAPAELKTLFDGIAEKLSAIQGPTYPLEDLISNTIENPWKGSSIDSLDALIGKSGQQDLLVSFRSENPPTPNLLVGGAVGQGKSNLLLDIIFSLATRYSPDEMELLLLDFKRGLEFKRFDKNSQGTGWLPHVKVLSLESNQEFGVAVLRHIERELERRSQLFKASGAHAITDYRADGNSLPRILLIIDEFHVLFDGDEQKTDEAVALLELIAKQGRAYGIHILLASQTTSGISGLRVKGESIFAQFAMRMSLKNTIHESEAILSQHNTAAADLTYRGEVIFNKNFGQDPAGSNIRGIAAWVNGDRFTQIQEQLWALGHQEEPLVFIGSDFAVWKKEQFKALQPRNDDMLAGWIGRPIAITDVPMSIELDTDINQSIALVGTGDELADHVLASFAITALQTIGEEVKVVILSGLNKLLPQVERLVTHLRDTGRQVEVVERRDIPEYLVNHIVPQLDSGDDFPTLILGLGMQRIPGMDKTIMGEIDSFDFSIDAVNTGKDALVKLARDGALQKMFFMGWWSSLEGVRQQLEFNRVGISKYLFLKVGAEDLREVAGPLAKASQDYPRVTFFDVGSDAGLIPLVPFDTVPEEVLGHA